MKTLNRMLLINWLYYEKMLLDFEKINYITGKNASGKSTFLDALMIVLLGEVSRHNFNKAANESSARTLEGYLRADMDKNNPRSRKGRSFCSYIACEFFDHKERNYFTLGVMFDCFPSGEPKHYFFTFKGEIPENCFIKDKHPMSPGELRHFLASNYENSKIYDTNSEYKRNVTALWNIHVPQVFSLLKRGVSFKPIDDIRKFITENLYDLPDRPDIVEMQQNVRDYNHLRRLAEAQEMKRDFLLNISERYQNWLQSAELEKIHKYLMIRAEMECAAMEVERNIAELNEQRQLLEQLSEQKAAFEAEYKILTERHEKLSAERYVNFEQERKRLADIRQRLEDDIKQNIVQLDDTVYHVRTEALRLRCLCEGIEGEPSLYGDAFAKLRTVNDELRLSLNGLENCDRESFVTQLLQGFEHVWRSVRGFQAVVQQLLFEYNDKLKLTNKELTLLKAELVQLNRGIRRYPEHVTGLKGQLEQKLPKQAEIHILADLLEVADPVWQDAAEGYLNTQKFYIIVTPEFYPEAGQIYQQVRKQYYGVGLIDIAKLRKRVDIVRNPGSLAEKITTDNEMARLYIDYLLGRVMCCDDESQLNKHSTAVTADGMYYRGYVKNAFSQQVMTNAFIGKRALEKRRSILAQNIAVLEGEASECDGICKALETASRKEPLFTEHYAQRLSSLPALHENIKTLESKLKDVEKAEDGLDFTWGQRIEKQINKLKAEAEAIRQSEVECAQEGAKCSLRIENMNNKMPELNDNYIHLENLYDELFDESFIQAIGETRYKEELSKLKSAAAIARNFKDRLAQTRSESGKHRDMLIKIREDYINRFPPCTFDPEADDNTEFDKQLALLNETELPLYAEKIKNAYESAMEQFQNDFLAKIKAQIDEVQTHVIELNRAIRDAQFGGDRYHFIVDKSPEYVEYYNMIMDPSLMEDSGGLFASDFQNRYRSLIASLFDQIVDSDETANSRRQSELQQNIERFTDYRTYLRFDLKTKDTNGHEEYLSETLKTKSGGETQTPFYIAILASFAQVYRTRDYSSFGNTMRLIVFDEAFNKMDSERIVECIRLLRKMGLQAIFSTPPDKLPDIMPEADCTFLAVKEDYHMQLIPWRKEFEELIYD